jgi:hypothetical protein
MRFADSLCKIHSVRFFGLPFLLLIALTIWNSSVPKTDRKTSVPFGHYVKLYIRAHCCRTRILFGSRSTGQRADPLWFLP